MDSPANHLESLGLVGLALNWLPYKLPGWLAGWLTTTLDEPASYKLMAGLMLFPLFWAAETAAAWRLGGIAAAIATLAIAPLTGYVALYTGDLPTAEGRNPASGTGLRRS